MVKFCIGSLNARGINGLLKRKRLFRQIRMQKFGIFFIQEVHSTDETELLWANEWGAKAIFSNGDSNARGVAILIDNKVGASIQDIWRDGEGRCLIITALIDGQLFCLANVYAHNRDRPSFFKKVLDKIDEMSCSHVIIGGDFNLVLDIDKDSIGRLSNNFNSSGYINQAMEEHELCDIWRVQHPDDRQFTWHRQKPVCRSRLDMFIVNYGLASNATKSNIQPCSISDHFIVSLSIEMDEIKRGAGVWKLNSQLLDDANVMTKGKSKIKEIEILYNDNKATKCHEQLIEGWELLKSEVKKIFIAEGVSKAGASKIEAENLYRTRKLLTDEVIRNNGHELTNQYLNNINSKIETIEIEQAKAAAFRSRSKWILDGERNTKYFYALEKRNYSAKCITKLQVAGEIVTEQKKILAEMSQFYADLYRYDKEVQFNIHNSSGLEYQRRKGSG